MTANNSLPSPQQPSTPRSVAPKVFGPISIVSGLLVGSVSLIALTNVKPSYTNTDLDMSLELEGLVGKITVLTGLQFGLIILLSIILIVLGIKQSAYARVALKGSIIWSIAALVSIGGFILLNQLILSPLWSEVFRVLSRGDEVSMAHSMSGFLMGSLSVLYGVLLTPYPVVMLIMFRWGNLRHSFPAS